ncbi:hypothetical protein GCM10008983_11810 [Lentibacillus halophilus]|uniref:SLH domain-containing protein n=1 Tax=Lentibacillus halophilus TaxID=295065 RepID=A0ABN0Z7J2_9BACI
MAEQKNYRKFAASSLAATAAVAAVAPAVSADSVSFTDVQEGDSHYEGIMALAEQGIVAGYEDGSFGVYDNVTRQQVAVMLFQALDLNTPADVEGALQAYDDVGADSLYAEEIAAVTEAGAFDGNNGMFNPNDEISREQMATVLVSGLGLDEDDNGEDVDVNLSNVSPSHESSVQVMANLGLTVELDNFRPNEEISRGAFATMLHGALNPESAKQQITNVSALTDDGHVLEVQFNKPMASIDKSEVSLYETASLNRAGVQSVDLAADGKSAEIMLYDNTSDNAPDEVERLTEYTLQIGDLETNFTRPEYLDDDDNARVIDVDSGERDVTVQYNENNGEGAQTKVNLDVPEDMDFNFQEALGQEIAIWYDGDDNVQDFNLITNEEVVYDAIEVTAKDEIETVDEGTEFDLAEDVQFIVNDGADSDDGNVEADGQEDVEALVNNEYDYAKVIFDDNGDVARVYAFDFTDDPVLVDEVDDNYILGKDSNDLDLEDYTIVKNGKEISIDDIEKGDVVFFNEDAYSGDGLAVVNTNTVKGEIDNVYDDSFDVDGKNYSYSGIQFLNEDGDFETIDDDDAKQLQDAGAVKLHMNHKNDIVYVTGEVGDFEKNYNSLYLQGDLTPYIDNKGDGMIEVEGVDSEGSSKLYDLKVSSLDQVTAIQDGEKKEFEVDEDFDGTEIDEFALGIEGKDGFVAVDREDVGADLSNASIIALDEDDNVIGDVMSVSEYLKDNGNLINLVEDDNNNIDELEFFKNTADLKSSIDEDSKYANGNLLENSTLVYDVSDAKESEYSDPDTEDVSATTWGDLKEKGIDISDAVVYSDEDGYVTHIVSYEDVVDDDTDETALIKRVDTSDDDITRIRALVNGEDVTYDVDKKDPSFDVEEGSVVEISISSSGDLVTGFTNLDTNDEDDRLVTGTVVKDGVSVSDNEVRIEMDGTQKTYELANDGNVYDATDSDASDYSDENLRDVEEGDEVTIALPDKGSKFADAVVMTGSVDSDDVPANEGNSDDSNDGSDNNAPEADASDQELEADGSVTLTVDQLATDADGDDLTVESVDVDGSSVSADTVDGELEVTAEEAGESTVTVEVSDGNATTDVEFVVTVAEESADVQFTSNKPEIELDSGAGLYQLTSALDNITKIEGTEADSANINDVEFTTNDENVIKKNNDADEASNSVITNEGETTISISEVKVKDGDNYPTVEFDNNQEVTVTVNKNTSEEK